MAQRYKVQTEAYLFTDKVRTVSNNNALKSMNSDATITTKARNFISHVTLGFIHEKMAHEGLKMTTRCKVPQKNRTLI